MSVFMKGRYGNDQLGFFIIVTGLVCYLISFLVGIPLFNYCGLALYVLAIVRIFSKNKMKRSQENQYYIRMSTEYQKKYKQFAIRIKNRKVYKYFKCPKCKALLRLSRGTGKTVVTCAKCKHEFNEKA